MVRMTMEGRLSHCLLLAYRTPVHAVEHLVPPGLRLVRHETWAFWNVVVCRVEQMRPFRFPAFTGISYHQVAYRLYVEASGECAPLRGLYFTRSDADSRLITLGGNRVSDFRFHHAAIAIERPGPGAWTARVETAGGNADALLRIAETGSCPPGAAPPAPETCFRSRDEARHVLKYAPVAMTPDRNGRRLRLAEVGRDENQWQEDPVHVVEARWNYLESFGAPLHLEQATRVAPIDYRWTLGGRVKLQATATRPGPGRPGKSAGAE